jgi:hypothetical protein
MSDVDDTTRAILNDARDAMVGGVVGAAAAAIIPTVGGGALLGAFPATLATGVGVACAWKEKDARRWWHHVIYDERHDNKTPEEIAGIIAAHQDQPFVRETILRSLRALLDSPDECTVTALAVLAREYLRDHKPPDYFFGASHHSFHGARGTFSNSFSASRRKCRPG